MITKKANLVRVLKNVHFAKNEPISLVHFITNRCNARCSFCFIDFDDPETFKGDLTIEEIEKISFEYHVYYSYQKKENIKDYTENLTANIYLLDEDNNVEKIFVPGTPFSDFFKYVNRYLLKDMKNLPLQ